MPERRQSPRMTYATAVRLEDANGCWKGKVRNISAEGMFIEPTRALPPGNRLKMAFRLRHSRKAFDMAGEVRRVTPEGVGIRILW